MDTKKQYNTAQKEIILGFLKSNTNTPFTAQMIADSLKGQVGQTTVYRHLEKLLKEHSVIRYEMPDGKGTGYKYSTADSCHILCTQCGAITALRCHLISELGEHISNKHQFNFDSAKTILHGVCNKCKLL